MGADRREGPVRIMRDGKSFISFSCNNTLGLTHHPDVIAAATAALEAEGSGSGASRAVTGSHPHHASLEQKLAAWKGFEAATLFGSGYLANLGAITALVEAGDLILLDKLSHASLLDAAQLSGARWMRFKHNDMDDLERLLKRHRASYRHCLIVTETVFSMDGDRAPLALIAAAAKANGSWWLADDAHGLGEGLPAKPDILTGTLSKALASYGGYALADASVIGYLQSAARSLIYSTALPPSVLAAAEAALAVAIAEPERCDRALRHARRFCAALGLPGPESHIVPLIFGATEAAVSASRALEKEGLLAIAIRPPTVAEGTARLRLSFSAAHEAADVERLIAAVATLFPMQYKAVANG